jgi:hypothetical protein
MLPICLPAARYNEELFISGSIPNNGLGGLNFWAVLC